MGLVLEGKGVLRSHQAVRFPDTGDRGEITSGTFSPTLQRGIAFARVPAEAAVPGKECVVVIRSKELPARLVRYPFVKDGEPAYTP